MADAEYDQAFAVRCEQLVVATTPLVALSATADGYARQDGGNFATEGFMVGMEVAPSGFPQTEVGVISAVTASTLRILGGRSPRSSAAGRKLSVGLPQQRTWDNTAFDPTPGVSYFSGYLVPQPGYQQAGQSQGGYEEDRGIYIAQWYGLAGYGRLGIRRCGDRLLQLFPPNYTFAAGAEFVRVSARVKPSASIIQQRASGHALLTLSIPYWVLRSSILAP